jgi:hypothetical protein
MTPDLGFVLGLAFASAVLARTSNQNLRASI